MSFRKPVNANVSQRFGADFIQNGKWYYKQVLGYNGHNGDDYAIGGGSPVYAADEGTVVFEGWGQNHSWMGSPAGICVLINNGGVHSGYAHLRSTVINKGQRVTKGQIIGYVGRSGAATGDHLHFEAMPLSPNFKNGYAGRIDPNQFMESTPVPPANQNNQGGNMPVKTTLDTARILVHGIVARNGLRGRAYTLDGSVDDDLRKNHVGVDLTNEYIQGLFLSQEGRQFRDTNDSNSVNGINQTIDFANTVRRDNWEQQIYDRTAERDAAIADREQLRAQLATANTEIARLKSLPIGGGIDKETRDAIEETRTNTNWLKEAFTNIFNIFGRK